MFNFAHGVQSFNTILQVTKDSLIVWNWFGQKKLNYKDTQKLLQSAGYYLSNSIPFDLIIKELQDYLSEFEKYKLPTSELIDLINKATTIK